MWERETIELGWRSGGSRWRRRRTRVDGKYMVSALMATRDADLGNLAADAASASAERTIEAIDDAAAKNDDPEVARILDEAALSADTTASRVSWLRHVLRRAFGKGASVTP